MKSKIEQSGFTLIQILVILMVATIVSPMLLSPGVLDTENTNKVDKSVAQTLEMIKSIYSQYPLTNAWPGGAGCSSAISTLEGAGYLVAGSATNAWGNPISISCSDDELKITQIASKDSAKILVSKISSTEISDSLTGEITTRLLKPGHQAGYDSYFLRDGTTKSTGDFEFNGHDLIHIKDLKSDKFVDVNDPTLILDPSSISTLKDLNVVHQLNVQNDVIASGQVTADRFQSIADPNYYIDKTEGTFNDLRFMGSISATIFVDSANPSYYLDPDSSSIVKIADINKLTSSRFQDSGDLSKYGEADSDTSANIVQISRSISPIFRDTDNAHTYIQMNSFSSIARLAIANGIYAPQFQSSSNTSLYADPSSTSILNTLFVDGDLTGTEFVYSGNNLYRLAPGGNSVLGATQTVSISASSYIDAANSNFFIDPSGISVLNSVSTNTLTIQASGSCTTGMIGVDGSGAPVSCVGGSWEGKEGGNYIQYPVNLYPTTETQTTSRVPHSLGNECKVLDAYTNGRCSVSKVGDYWDVTTYTTAQYNACAPNCPWPAATWKSNSCIVGCRLSIGNARPF